MEKLWAGRAASELNALADDFNTSLPFDCRMYRQDIQGSMALKLDFWAEDIHSLLEGERTAWIGDPGRKLHTARSRNDQVALDLRLYLRQETAEIQALLKKLISAICRQAEENKDVIAPGYTHL